jgi:DNA-binding MarR family transcriptional regulator
MSLEDQEGQSSIRRLLSCIEVLRDADPDMPLVSAALLLSIAVNEGVTQRELIAKLKIPSSTASRSISVLSDVARVGKQGLGLVTWYDDPTDRRIKRLLLTPKGRSIVQKLLEAY